MHPHDTRKPNQRLWLAVLALAIIASAAGTIAIQQAFDGRDTAQTETAVAKATTKQVGKTGRDLANEVLSACAGSSKSAKELRSRGLCGQATDTKQQIAQSTPGATGPAGLAGQPGIQGQTGAPGATGAAGATGTAGAAGINGANGSQGAPGPQGPPGPSGSDGKPGADGAPGPAGPSGTDGRGIRDAQCGDDGRWTVTYTDGTTSDAGACRPSVLP